MTLDCSEQLIQNWVVYYTNYYLLLYAQSNGDTCEVETMYKVCCSIYRVNDPSGSICQFWCYLLLRVAFLSNESENVRVLGIVIY
jgi:hypothetical protein